MDVVNEVMTIGAISITAFEYRLSTIIVFAQSIAENPWINSEVYEFKDSNIVRIQFLSTARPTSVHHYVHGDFNFVLMINALGLSDVFCWDGLFLLIFSFKVKYCLKCKKFSIKFDTFYESQTVFLSFSINLTQNK